jgi:hypothetical protein
MGNEKELDDENENANPISQQDNTTIIPWDIHDIVLSKQSLNQELIEKILKHDISKHLPTKKICTESGGTTSVYELASVSKTTGFFS